MINKIRLLVICFLSVILQVSAQNSEEFFKVFQKPDGAEPQWVQMMYSPNPNVYEVVDSYRAYYQSNLFKKNIHTQNYKYWVRSTKDWLTPDGFIRVPSTKEQLRKLAKISEKRGINSAKNQSVIWQNIGPNQTYSNDGALRIKTSQVNIYCMGVAPSDSTILYAAAEGGGVFKSTDHGRNWYLMTLNEPFTYGQDIKVHPTNPNIVYVASRQNLYKTLDGGLSWTLSHTMPGNIEQLLIHKDSPNKVFATTAGGLFYTNNKGSSWTNVLNEKCWDIVANPLNPNTIYLSTSNPTALRAEIRKSLDGGETWCLMDTGWYVPTDLSNASDLGCKIGLTPADTSRVYACLIGDSKAGDNGWIGVYYSLDGAESWINSDGIDGGPYANGKDKSTNWFVAGYTNNYHQGWYNFDLDVSHTNPDKIWIGTIWYCESSDRGASIEYIRGTRGLDMHADIQDIDVVGNDVWITSDGGINYSSDECMTVETRVTGIGASTFWGFSQGWNEDTWTGGRYHNGDALYHENFGVGNSLYMGGAEAATGYIDPLDNRKSYYSDITSKITPDALNQRTNSFSKLSIYPNESYAILNSSELEHDPRYADHFYMGRDNFFYKSTNGGLSFNALYTFAASARVLEFELSRINPKLIYVIVRDSNEGRLYKSTDGGNNFTPLAPIPSNNISRLDLSLNPENDDHLWVTSFNGANGKKIYMTTDGGQTWVNKTTSTLDNNKIIDVLYQAGTNDVVYLATDYGVYYYDVDAQDWILYAEGLPLMTRALKFKAFYRDSKLRLSSGRGIWEAPFAVPSRPIAQPYTAHPTIDCSRDTIQLDCYSFLDHEGATWNWNFSPAPSYISSPTIRNPRVAFDQSGSYDVTLTITDKNGDFAIKTVNDMITLDNRCAPDSIPGYALECNSYSDYVVIPNLGISTNTVTFMAWIKPAGTQFDYCGIIMNESGGKAGLNFINGNQLGYHWPGGQVTWNSNLEVDTSGAWSHIAMVVTPSNVTLYLNGVPSVHDIALPPTNLGIIKLGSYKGSNRNFKGEIDEVAIWNRALSQEEIRDIRHLTRTADAPVSAEMVAYYQFNDPNSNLVIDKIANNQAYMSGSATKIVSTAPVAGGSSHRLTVNAAGNYVFGDTDVEIEFSEGKLPNGEIVVSHLHFRPDSLPSSYPNIGNYWVVNNYGMSSISPLVSLKLKPQNVSLSADIKNDASTAKLYKRNSNEHLNNWVEQCGAASAQENALVFDNTCNQTGFSQFFISSADPNIELLPVELLSFEAEVENHDLVRLKWTSAMEIDNDHYLIERSADGQNWRGLEVINGAGTSSAAITYTFFDRKPLLGRSYYRLKQVDVGGEYGYSEIVTVFIKALEHIGIQPNPATDQVTISTYGYKERLRLRFYSVAGKLKKDVFITEEEQEIDVTSLSKGVYFYIIEGEGFVRNGKLVVQ